MNRPTPHDTQADIVRFMTLARGGRDRRNEINAAMRRHPAGKARTVAPSAHAAEGMSTRAIAPIVGVHHDTVYRDQKSSVGNQTVAAPRVSHGLDGKTRTHQPPLLNADGTPATPLPTTTPEDR